MTATCACGNATISVNRGPSDLGICHCTNCKRRTGSAFGISAYFDIDAVTERTGNTSVYSLRNDFHNHEQHRHFCTTCGTTLYWFVSTLPSKIGIAGGCFDNESLPEPTYTTNDRKRYEWLSIPTKWDNYAGTDT